MKCKLLSVEIEYDGELDNVEIVTKYGKILEQEDFKELKDQMERLNKDIVKVIQKELEKE